MHKHLVWQQIGAQSMGNLQICEDIINAECTHFWNKILQPHQCITWVAYVTIFIFETLVSYMSASRQAKDLLLILG